MVSFINDLTVVEKEVSKIKIKLVLVTPKYTRSNKNDINIIINNRPINNYVLKESIINGYHSRIMVKRYPIAVLYIDIDPSLVDVNIHPQKLEIKISNEYFLASLIEKSIQDAFLEKIHSIPTNLSSRKINQNLSEEEYDIITSLFDMSINFYNNFE